MAKTIDNLGVDVSNRYAQDQRQLDESLLKESGAIPPQTQVDVTIPSFPSEFELLFDLAKRNIQWADFFAPLRYNEQKKRLFTYQIIPSLGSEDKKEAQLTKIRSFTRKEKEKEGKEKDQTMEWEEEREKQEEEKEKKILLNLLNMVISLDKFLIDINARRRQYQKG